MVLPLALSPKKLYYCRIGVVLTLACLATVTSFQTGSIINTYRHNALIPVSTPIEFPQQSTQINQRRRPHNQRCSNYATTAIATTTGMSSSAINTLMTKSYYSPLLDVALDRPLYPPFRKFFWSKTNLFGANIIRTGILGSLKVLFHKLYSIMLSTLSSRIFKFLFIFTMFVFVARYVITSDILTNISTSSTSNVIEPLPFDPNINEGWSICKLKSIQPYGKTSFLLADMVLPKRNYILPLSLGQRLHVCGLDRDGNAIQAEFYPYQPQRQVRSGYVSLLLPDPSKYTLQQQSNLSNDDVQQLQVAQLLQDYVQTGDTEIAIHPGISKLEYRGTYPVTDIIYVVIGTGIVPVLDQIRAVLKTTSPTSDTSGIEFVSLVWINHSIDDFDIISKLLKNEYYDHSTKLAVTCGVETNLQPSITQPQAAQYFFENNIEINDTVPNFQPGMMLVLSIEGIQSASLLRTVATTYMQQKKGFPNECICVM
jgi:hypothetical protein